MSVGVKSTCRVCPLSAPITVPNAGVYTKVPDTGLPLWVAVALSCVAPRAVPYTMSTGLDQVMTGVALMYKVPFPVAKSLALVDAFTVKDVVPAGVDPVVVIVNVDVFEEVPAVSCTEFGKKE